MSMCIGLQNLPVEIRLRIYEHLFVNQTVNIEFEHPDRVGNSESPRMKAVPIGAQLIRTCKTLHQEACVRLYAGNVFNCCQREGMKLLLQNIGPRCFALVRHVIIDWDQLQDFSWSLAKPEYKEATRGLQVLELATWRRRILGTSSFLGRSTRSYERQLCQSAVDICRKHGGLKVVAQARQQRLGRAGAECVGIRVKWRFLVSEKDMSPEESALLMDMELDQFKDDQDDADRTPSLIIDAF